MRELQEKLDNVQKSDSWGVEVAEILLREGTRANLTDLHISPRKDETLIRSRRHGKLLTVARLRDVNHELLIARFKVLSKLPAYKKNETQDGRIEWSLEGDGKAELLTLRTSFLPTIHGENLVIRFPEEGFQEPRLELLGLPDALIQPINNLINRQDGVVFLAGPSNSGKTTTMHAIMIELFQRHGDRLAFMTIEDPVERSLAFAEQVQVNDAIEFGFEKAMRSALRQDPDVLLVGEIRDLTTAKIALQAGLTGHLVLTSVHTGRSYTVFSRLLSLGIEPYVLSSSVRTVIAQRLVSKLCHSCREYSDELKGYQAKGCEQCDSTGVEGRQGLFEMLRVNEEVRELVLSAERVSGLRSELQKHMIYTLEQHGKELVDAGTLSPAEYHFTLDNG